MTHAPQIGRLLLFFLADFFNDGLRWLCPHTGAVQVPAWLPQVYQIGHDGPGRAALQSCGGFRQNAVWRDPQNAEGADPCWPDQNHARWGLEEGKGRQVKVQKTTRLQKKQNFSSCFFHRRQHIIYSYNEHSGITVQEAKIDFLRTISSWPTFGCTFFEVKVSHQSSEPSMPSTVWVVINKQGVSITNPKTKVRSVVDPYVAYILHLKMAHNTSWHSRRW